MFFPGTIADIASEDEYEEVKGNTSKILLQEPKWGSRRRVLSSNNLVPYDADEEMIDH